MNEEMSARDARERLFARDHCLWSELHRDLPSWVRWELRAGIRLVQFVFDSGRWVFKLFHQQYDSAANNWTPVAVANSFDDLLPYI